MNDRLNTCADTFFLSQFPILTVRQPYANLLVSGKKPYEYRNWKLPDLYLDKWILIHASKDIMKERIALTKDEYEDAIQLLFLDHDYNAVVGAVKFGMPSLSVDTRFKYIWPVIRHVKFDHSLQHISGSQRIWFYNKFLK